MPTNDVTLPTQASDITPANAEAIANALLAKQVLYAATYLVDELGEGLHSDDGFDYAGTCIDVLGRLLSLAYEGTAPELASFLFGTASADSVVGYDSAGGLCPELRAIANIVYGR